MSDATLDDSALGSGPARTAASNGADVPSDLGFGAVVSRESRQRLLNRDGTFNVRRKGLGVLGSQSAYHFLLAISWPRFLTLLSLSYLAVNAAFALVFMAIGEDAFRGLADEGVSSGFPAYLFFSVHTFASIGYGHVVPQGMLANFLVVLEAVASLLFFGVAAGLMFARFARPNAQIRFSDVATVAPYRGGHALMFRIVNGRDNQLLEVQAKVVLTRRRSSGGGREYHVLTLERERVTFFPLAWTVVHPIDERSPLFGQDPRAMARDQTELLVLLSGFDETFSQVVHARSSYVATEVVWGRRFADMFDRAEDDGGLAIDVDRLSETVS